MKFLRGDGYSMKVLAILLFAGLNLASLGTKAAEEENLRAIWLNRAGLFMLKEQNFAESFHFFVQALEYNPYAPEIHLNMGLALEGQGQGDKALKAYATALSLAKEPGIRFQAFFNLAQLYGKAKRYDEALYYYQKALEIIPDSHEIKINIELLIQDQQQNKDKGQGDSQDKKDKGDGQDDKKDDKDGKGDDKDKDKPKDGPKKYADNPKPQPKPFKGENLNEGDVKKILGELKNQEQRIRREYYKKDLKDKGHDKDW